MSQTEQWSYRRTSWRNLIFFVVMAVIGIVGTPLYIIHYGITLPEVLLFLFFTGASGMGITVGYHRYFAHQTYKTNRFIEFLLLFFASAAFEETALTWSSQHRDHHQYVDTDRDPYSIKKGFWYAHIGWLLFWKHKLNYSNVEDLQKNPMVVHQNKHYLLWSAGAGIITPVLIGALMGHALGAFIISVCFRITFVYHATFCINSVCHMFGKSTYNVYQSAKDHWLVALVTFGEGYHNFHHRFPSDYRNAVRWYQFDPSKWLIAGLSKIGMTWDLRKVSEFRIIEARLAGERTRISDSLQGRKHLQLQIIMGAFKERYEFVKHSLIAWETATKKYQAMVCEQVTKHSSDMRESALNELRKKKEQFHRAHEQWMELTKQPTHHLQQMLLVMTP